MQNREAKYAIFVSKYMEALPPSIGCFNCFSDDRIVCSIGSMNDTVLHEEIVNAAYCFARTQILKSTKSCVEVDFKVIDASLNEVKKQLSTFNTIKTKCTNIDDASKKIREMCDEIKDGIQQNLNVVWKELEKDSAKTQKIHA